MPVWPNDKMTRFEVARILGARSLQIALGAPLLVKQPKDVFDSITLAENEFKEIKVPMTIKRTMPSGEIIIIDVKVGIKNWLGAHSGQIG